MSTAEGLDELGRALRRENVDGWHCEQVLAEARQHLTESGEVPPDRRTVGELSGGRRQKLDLVLAALGDPAVLLLLDEPYQGFDGDSFLDFWEQVWHWRDDGRTVVVVTHRAEQLKRVDAVLQLGRPRVAAGEWSP